MKKKFGTLLIIIGLSPFLLLFLWRFWLFALVSIFLTSDGEHCNLFCSFALEYSDAFINAKEFFAQFFPSKISVKLLQINAVILLLIGVFLFDEKQK